MFRSFFLLLLLAAPLAADEFPSPSTFTWRSLSQSAFQPGESVSYVIKYGFIHSGFASLEVRGVDNVSGRTAYHIVSVAKTNKGTDIFFKVRDTNETWIDLESFCSLRFSQSLREGSRRRQTRTQYDHPSGTYVFWKERKGHESTREGNMPPFVQDILSSLFYVRTLNLQVGNNYEFLVNSGGKNWPLVLHVKRLERIRVPAGRFECLLLEPVLSGEGIFQQEGKLEIWVTNDEKKVPVLLRSKVLVGAFDAEMQTYHSGLGGQDTLSK